MDNNFNFFVRAENKIYYLIDIDILDTLTQSDNQPFILIHNSRHNCYLSNQHIKSLFSELILNMMSNSKILNFFIAQNLIFLVLFFLLYIFIKLIIIAKVLFASLLSMCPQYVCIWEESESAIEAC
jgi:hypothetical protein